MMATQGSSAPTWAVPSIADLIGHAKQNSDLCVKKEKLIWNSSATIVPNQKIELDFNRYDDQFLDPRSLRACFFLQGVSSDTNAIIDGTIQTVFQTVKVRNGTQLVCEFYEAGLLFTQLRDLNLSLDTSTIEKQMYGEGTSTEKKAWFALAAPGRMYQCHPFPKKSWLNSDCLVPLSRMNKIQAEFTFNSAARTIYSTTDANATYIITGFELHCDYVQSPTISAYYNSNPMRITVQDYAWSQGSLLSAVDGLLRVPSNSKSLNKLLIILRDGTTSQAIATADKNRVAKAGNLISQYNIRVNGKYMYSEPVTGWATIC